MPRRILILCGLLPALAVPSAAQASNASLEHALLAYKTTLTADLTFLGSTGSAPTKAAATSLGSKFEQVQADMAKIGRIARGQTPSNSAGRTAQSDVLTALSDAYGSAGDGLAAVAAVRAGQTSTASADMVNEQAEIARSIPDFELGAKALGFFG